MSHGAKRLMILGAGAFQVPAVKKAVELGCHVITVDNIAENVGHRHSHESVNCSTVDQDRVLEHATRLEIDGIMTMASDVAVPTVAFVADQLRMPAPAITTANVFTDKARFREFQSRHVLTHPLFDAGASPDKIDWSRFLAAGAVIIKPCDASGSRGVARVETLDQAARERAFQEAKNFSRSGQVCVEEYVDGLDVTGEGFLFEHGEPIVAFTEKFTDGCRVTGHRLPGPLNEHQQKLATDAILAACRAADYREGPFDADLRVTNESAVILEMSPRLGGNACPLLLRAYTGVDPIELTIRLALGERAPRPKPALNGGSWGSAIISSDRAGILESIRTMEQMQAALPYIKDGAWAVRPGDRIHRFRHGGDILGVVVFASDSSEDYAERSQRIAQEAGIQVISKT